MASHYADDSRSLHMQFWKIFVHHNIPRENVEILRHGAARINGISKGHDEQRRWDGLALALEPCLIFWPGIANAIYICDFGSPPSHFWNDLFKFHFYGSVWSSAVLQWALRKQFWLWQCRQEQSSWIGRDNSAKRMKMPCVWSELMCLVEVLCSQTKVTRQLFYQTMALLAMAFLWIACLRRWLITHLRKVQ